jgi:hypothetical protein
MITAMYRLILLVAAGWLIGCSSAAPQYAEPPPPKHPNSKFEKLSLAIKGISGNEVTLLEGLPSQFWEPQLREKELKERATIDVQGHPLYEEPLALSAGDRDKLTAICSASKSYQQYRSNKQNCNEFHVDYCIEWKTAEGTTQLLVCLECGEVEVHGPSVKLYCDFNDDAAKAVRGILSHYVNHRPEADSGA